MTASHAAAPRGPARGAGLAELRQWAIDHDEADKRQFESIDRKLNWLIGGIVAVLLTVIGGMANELWAQRAYVPPPAAEASALR